MAARPFRILFFSPSDPVRAIFASGLLKHMHEEAPKARFTIVAEPPVAPLFRAAPQLEDLLTPGRGAIGAIRLWTRLRRRRWDFVLDAEGLTLSGLAPARQRSRLPQTRVEGEHGMVAAARLLRLEDKPPAPFLFVDEEADSRASKLIGEDTPLLAMAPTAGWIGRTWPLERFARTAVQLLGEDGVLAGGRLLIVGAPEDRAAAETLRRSAPGGRWIDLTSETDPLVVHACLARARLFIGGASWLTHLAAAAGAPTLALFGPTDEEAEGVWGPDARVVRGPRSFEAIRAVDPGLDQPVCHMLDLKVETVVEAAARLLEETASEERRRQHA